MKWWLVGIIGLLVVAFGLGVSGRFLRSSTAELKLPEWLADALSRPIELSRVTPECRPLMAGRCLILPGDAAGGLPLAATPSCRGARIRFEPKPDPHAGPAYTLRVGADEALEVQVPKAGATLTLLTALPQCQVWVGSSSVPDEPLHQ